MSANGLDKLVFGFVLDINEKVRCRRVIHFLLKYLLAVLDVGNITVVIFAPDFLREVVYVNPVVAKADRPTVDEDRLEAIWKTTKVAKLALDV